jgi:hypothetical protein
MYRLLDLIMEQGSTSLGNSLFVVVRNALTTASVDKIVIAQESLQAFINALSPGAYSSITKVNFKKLDDLLLKPIGVYGSKEETVRFLREMGIVDVEMCVYPSLAMRRRSLRYIGRGNYSFHKATTQPMEQNPF